MYWDHWDKNRRCRSTVIADSIVRKKRHIFSHTFFVFSALKDVHSAICQIFGQDASISVTTAASVKYKHILVRYIRKCIENSTISYHLDAFYLNILPMIPWVFRDSAWWVVICSTTCQWCSTRQSEIASTSFWDFNISSL